MAGVDEYGIPIKERPSENVDEFGIVIKKKVGTVDSTTGGTDFSLPASSSEAPLPSTEKTSAPPISGYNIATLNGVIKPAPAKDVVTSVAKDRENAGSFTAGVYNTLVESLSRMGGGIAATASYLGGILKSATPAGRLYNEIQGQAEQNNPEFSAAAVARDKVTQIIEKARSSASTKEQEAARSEFDVTDGIDAQDVKAVAFQAPSQIADMVAGAYTGGASFFVQSVNDSAKELEENPNANKLSTAHKLGYLFTQAATQAVLEKFAIDKILKGTGVSKKISQKISSEIIDEFAEKGIKATAKQIEEAAFRKASTLTSKIKAVGVKAATSIGTEGSTEAIQSAASDAIKLLSNKVSGQEVFDETDISQNFVKNLTNAGVQGGLMGGVFGGVHAVTSNTNKAIRREISEMSSPEDLAALKDRVSQSAEQGELTPQEAELANTKADQYAEMAAKIPGEISADQKYALIGGIEQREQLKKEIEKANADILAIDPAFHGEKMTQLQLLNAKLEQTNDYLHELATGEKVLYVQKDGEYFKVDSRGDAKITKQYYDLATAVDEENERKGTPVAPAVIMPDEINRPTEEVAVAPDETVPSIEVLGKDKDGAGISVSDLDELNKNLEGIFSPSDIQDTYSIPLSDATKIFNKWLESKPKSTNGANSAKAIVEPMKPISQMNSEELLAYSDEVKSALKEQDKKFADKTEQEKIDGGYYDYIDNVSDIRDTAQRVNFVENSENLDELADSTKAALRNLDKNNPSEDSLAILNAARSKVNELNIAPETLLKEVIKKVGNDYVDREDAELMMRDVLEKVMPSNNVPQPSDVKQIGNENQKQGQEILQQQGNEGTASSNESVATKEGGTSKENVVQNEQGTEAPVSLSRDTHTGILHRPGSLKISEEVRSKFQELDNLRKAITEEGANRKERKNAVEKFLQENPRINAIDKHFSDITEEMVSVGTLKKNAECP